MWVLGTVRGRRGERGTCTEASVLLQAVLRTLVNVHMGTSKSPLPLLQTSAPGEQSRLQKWGVGHPEATFLFSVPSPRAFSRRSLAECVPWNLGPPLLLHLMLLCSMLNEARTFTQVTFIILLSRTLSCAPRAVSAGREELSCWSGRAGLEWGERAFLCRFCHELCPWAGHFCGLQLPPHSFSRYLSLTLPGPVLRAGNAGI